MSKRKIKHAAITVYHPTGKEIRTNMEGDKITVTNTPEGTTITATDKSHEVLQEMFLPFGTAHVVKYSETVPPKAPKVPTMTMLADTLTFGAAGQPPAMQVSEDGKVEGFVAAIKNNLPASCHVVSVQENGGGVVSVTIRDNALKSPLPSYVPTDSPLGGTGDSHE